MPSEADTTGPALADRIQAATGGVRPHVPPNGDSEPESGGDSGHMGHVGAHGARSQGAAGETETHKSTDDADGRIEGVPDGWSASSWATDCRRRAAVCADANPEQSKRWTAEAERIEATLRDAETVAATG